MEITYLDRATDEELMAELRDLARRLDGLLDRSGYNEARLPHGFESLSSDLRVRRDLIAYDSCFLN